MSGGAPVIVKANDPQEKILCIADLEKVGSSKLTKVARGQCARIRDLLAFLCLFSLAIDPSKHLLSPTDV